MSNLRFELGASGAWRVYGAPRGRDLLSQPLLNRGTAFTHEERRALGIEGLLPSAVSSLELQARRSYRQIVRKADPLERYIGMSSLQDRNEVLFHRVLLDHVEELLPIVYTPTVGEACRSYSDIFRRGRGIWITPEHKGRVREVLANAPRSDVRLIVVTDNERILGLGDQGAGGMGIPIGKLALYTCAAGIHPAFTLPVSLDVGTDNRALLADELYVGWRHPRLRGAQYAELVEEFVRAVMGLFPGALLQWEDFKKGNAFALLDRYRDVLPSFNDDIQGTAAVALACVLAAGRIRGLPLRQERILITGAGAAGIGIARQLRDALARAGLSGEELRGAIAVLDSHGLLIEGRELDDAYKREFCWPAGLARAHGFAPSAPPDLLTLVRALRPTTLIGTSGEPGAFGEQVVRAMRAGCERPAILPFSNPTEKSEADPADLVRWTGGSVLIATGSPFPAPEHAGRRLRVSQGNNVYVFPGVGLGAMVSRAKRVSDAMFTAAAEALAGIVSPSDLEQGALLPPLTLLRGVSRRIASAVARQAREEGVGLAQGDDEIERAIEREVWEPAYPEL